MGDDRETFLEILELAHGSFSSCHGAVTAELAEGSRLAEGSHLAEGTGGADGNETAGECAALVHRLANACSVLRERELFLMMNRIEGACRRGSVEEASKLWEEAAPDILALHQSVMDTLQKNGRLSGI